MIPTTYVTILEEKEGTDEFGDPVDEYSAIARKVPAHIYETSSIAFDPNSGQTHTVKTHKIMFPAGTTIAKGYRVREDDTYYLVEDVTEYTNFVNAGHIEAVTELVK